MAASDGGEEQFAMIGNPQTGAALPTGIADATIGFIGLGVMGEAMCANLQRRTARPVVVFDLNHEPVSRLVSQGAKAATSIPDLAGSCGVVLLSLPNAEALQSVMEGDSGLIANLSRGSMIIDTSTSPVDLTRRLGAEARENGVGFADAPVARTREAAARGELSIMVGSSPELFAAIEPVLRTMGTDVTLCGPVGAGQVVKIVNNLLLFLNVMGLAEGIAVARHAGVAPELLLEVVAKGSGDSFALRNHGMKTMLPRSYPERAFSTKYAKKDLALAMALARESGIELAAAELLSKRLDEAEAAGLGDKYFPAILEIIDPPIGSTRRTGAGTTDRIAS
jgi:3-hydroxyisobutyrate dehydrogenase-like beta-hydroxyacid dehydrogenase